MNLKTFISHPYTLMTSFFLVITGSQPIGGFYFLYLLSGLSYGAVYSIVGSMGIVLILYSHFKYKKSSLNLDACFINLIGAVLLVISLFLFCYHSHTIDIPESFKHPLPLTSLLIFCFLVTCFVTMLSEC